MRRNLVWMCAAQSGGNWESNSRRKGTLFRNLKRDVNCLWRFGPGIRYDCAKSMTPTYTRRAWLLLFACLIATSSACNRSVETSVAQARQHVSLLVDVSATDVDELQKGLPEGATELRSLYKEKIAPKDDLEAVRKQLGRARNHVQDLRVAKSTFFALIDRDGTILRSDREPDLMSGKNLFSAFPETRQSLDGKLVISRGEMPEASGVKGRKDGQFVVSVPVGTAGAVDAVYASGWSWAAYAYRLQNALIADVRGKRKNDREKDPLMYVYIAVDDAVFGAPQAPEVNAEAIRGLAPLSKVSGDEVFAAPLEVTGRDFGLALRRAPRLGPNVAVAVLRSET